MIPQGDFVGFSFNGYHSSDLGISRVSNGDRYESNLLPPLENKSMQMPGNDETYYWNMQYKTKPFTINIAFDSLSEVQIRNIKRLFSKKQLGSLILDETPYMYFLAKISEPPKLKYICFDTVKDGNIRRVYKGEGTIVFSFFFPFGISRYKYKEDYNAHKIDEWRPENLRGKLDTDPEMTPAVIAELEADKGNLVEWEKASRIKNRDLWSETVSNVRLAGRIISSVSGSNITWTWENGQYDKFYSEIYRDDYKSGQTNSVPSSLTLERYFVARLYNSGDRDSPLKITLPFNTNSNFGEVGKIPPFILTISASYPDSDGVYFDYSIKFNEITKQGDDTGIIIDSNLGLVRGYKLDFGQTTIDDDTITDNIYNDCISGGDFLKVMDNSSYKDQILTFFTDVNSEDPNDAEKWNSFVKYFSYNIGDCTVSYDCYYF